MSRRWNEFAERASLIWSAYALLLLVLAGICFASLTDHLLDIHDAETFRDNLGVCAVRVHTMQRCTAKLTLITGSTVAISESTFA